MDWSMIIENLFEVVILPLLGVLTTAAVYFIQKKIEYAKATTESELTVKYLTLLESTIVDCLLATNQTYVAALKEQGRFDAEAQEEALKRTVAAVLDILSEDAKTYLTHFVGDLDVFIEAKIEANIIKTKAEK